MAFQGVPAGLAGLSKLSAASGASPCAGDAALDALLFSEDAEPAPEALYKPSNRDFSVNTPVNAPSTERQWPWPLRSEAAGRVQQKEQRARLLQDVREMEALVAQLQAQRPANVNEGAKREREAKRDAECSNLRLRQLNAQHVKRIKRIDRVMEQSLSDYEKLLASERLEYDPEADAELYRELRSRQEEQLQQQEAVFAAAGLARDTAQLNTAQVVTDRDGRAIIRFSVARVVPFPIKVILGGTERYHSQYMVFPPYDEDPQQEGSQDNVNVYGTTTIKARFILRQNEARPVPLDTRGVGKIVRDGKNHVRGVWSGEGEWPPEYAPDRTSTVPIREKGWIRLREFSKKHGGQRYTLMQSCIHMSPGISNAASKLMSQRDFVALVAETVIPSYSELLLSRQQTMENVFMDELLREQKLAKLGVKCVQTSLAS